MSIIYSDVLLVLSSISTASPWRELSESAVPGLPAAGAPCCTHPCSHPGSQSRPEKEEKYRQWSRKPGDPFWRKQELVGGKRLERRIHFAELIRHRNSHLTFGLPHGSPASSLWLPLIPLNALCLSGPDKQNRASLYGNQCNWRSRIFRFLKGCGISWNKKKTCTILNLYL